MSSIAGVEESVRAAGQPAAGLSLGHGHARFGLTQASERHLFEQAVDRREAGLEHPRRHPEPDPQVSLG